MGHHFDHKLLRITFISPAIFYELIISTIVSKGVSFCIEVNEFRLQCYKIESWRVTSELRNDGGSWHREGMYTLQYNRSRLREGRWGLPQRSLQRTRDKFASDREEEKKRRDESRGVCKREMSEAKGRKTKKKKKKRKKGRLIISR